MDIHLIEIVVLLLFLFLSAFFSGSETALFSLKKSDILRFSLSENKIERSIYKYMIDPQKILITILIGNLFVNLIISAISTRLLLQKWGNFGHLISIAIVTPIMIIFCEISPKVISINLYESLSKKIFPVLRIFHKIFYPIRVLLLIVTDAMINFFGLKLNHERITEDELDLAVNLGEQEGVIDKGEGTFIKNVLRFSKKDASNTMFPRNSALFIPYGTSVKNAMNIFLESGTIRAPIYKDDFDHVIGMVDSRDLIPYYLGYKKAININRFINEIKFFPESRELNDLLNDFLSDGIQIAVIVDEFGGTAGVVTLNKILSEILGKEFSKWEEDYKPDIRRIDGNISIISGEMQIDDFNYNFNESITSQNSDSVGGYIIEKISYFPKRGEEILTKKYILRVKYIRKNKIETIEVIQRESEED